MNDTTITISQSTRIKLKTEASRRNVTIKSAAADAVNKWISSPHQQLSLKKARGKS